MDEDRHLYTDATAILIVVLVALAMFYAVAIVLI